MLGACLLFGRLSCRPTLDLKLNILELLSPSLPPAGRNPKNSEGLGFVKALRGVVASGGSKSSKIEGLGFLQPLLSGVVASDGKKFSKNEDLGFFKPPLRGVVAGGIHNT